MERKELRKSLSAGVTDVDTAKGITCGYFSTFGDEDSDGDIVTKGAFLKSIKENGPEGTGRIKHLLDHHKLIGKLLTLKEDNKGLYYESQITKAPRGADFLIMCQEGLITEHSFFGYAIKWEKNPMQPERGVIYKEILLREGSTMELWGANANAKMTTIKSDSEAVAWLEQAQQIGSLSDETLQGLATLYETIKKGKNTEPPRTLPNEADSLIHFFTLLTANN